MINRQIIWTIFSGIAGSVLFGQSVLAQALPQFSDSNHLGVASCASSTCHAAATPNERVAILQNEFITWQKYDKHAKAYTVLTNDESKRIASNLGLKSATEAKICLDCHADNVAEKNRGPQFQIDDGVGCEACHAGGTTWLGQHISGGTHDDNLKAGMFPTEDPVKRAELCLSCHFGDSNKFVTHRIMGAGHPRMSFELDTFTAIQPAHFARDADYFKRKSRVVSGVQTWAIGQALAMGTIMDGLADKNRNRQGLFPELVFFDCHSCHHPMSNKRWTSQPQIGIGPGLVRLNDANLIMLELITAQFDEGMSKEIRAKTRALHAGSQSSFEKMVTVAKDLKGMSKNLASMFAAQTFDKNTMTGLFNRIVDAGKAGRYSDYASAEQAAMALGSLADAMREAQFLTGDQHNALQAQIDKVFEAVKNDEVYQRGKFKQALGGLKLASL